MPELPEVEITTRNLNKIIQPPEVVQEWIFYRKDLRNVIPVTKIKKLNGSQLKKISRRAKFIIFEFENDSIVSHLGMTGYWRVETKNWQKKAHDHIAMKLNEDKYLVYNDPRRFGEFDIFKNSNLHERFAHFGPEPLQQDLDLDVLTKTFKKINSTIKVALMNQKYLVGVGNIYASEALFRSKIKPHKKANKVRAADYALLWTEVKKVLQEAIEAGGSSISDFKNSYGEKGDFQKRFLVYDRKDELCFTCHHPIQSLVLGGRSTFWCRHCQK
ncbi:MAG: bifunctional DNA-formamidopyrimidine glycosylase/DNA-(apurinic or apyrimidinic site) lyase [Bdellovibrio sp.]|nr:bifunctional DNA-formamidopyrimidine glycosylase/DNA-(apurinic or apyrimidinic site) lyase [Bdellovibrio sp.]